MGTRGPSLPVAVLAQEITVARPCHGYYVISMSPKKRSRTSKDVASSMTEISHFQTQVASSDLLVNGI